MNEDQIEACAQGRQGWNHLHNVLTGRQKMMMMITGGLRLPSYNIYIVNFDLMI